ncbi:hypothetical protein LP420_20035 [Massilia sp. B-10]|nr:hypothetical protein LP420_20035 [Massilia sp. B-10]UUZ56919.1 hypothetical protein LP419_19440 [Massilia sp. H-1]
MVIEPRRSVMSGCIATLLSHIGHAVGLAQDRLAVLHDDHGRARFVGPVHGRDHGVELGCQGLVDLGGDRRGLDHAGGQLQQQDCGEAEWREFEHGTFLFEINGKA